MNLNNRVAVITGANRGLGESIARAFAKAGAGLVLSARDGELMQRVAEDISQSAARPVEWISADVSRPADVDAIRECAVRTFGRVDILVNNAGIYGPIGAFEDADWQEWCDALRINLFGTVAMSRAIVPLMKQQQYGKV